MHKKTTNWRILVFVVKWRHRAIVLLTQISPKRAIASYWWILVALSAAYFSWCYQNASQRLIGSQTFFLFVCFICLHIWITRDENCLPSGTKKNGLVYLSASLIIHNNRRDSRRLGCQKLITTKFENYSVEFRGKKFVLQFHPIP